VIVIVPQILPCGIGELEFAKRKHTKMTQGMEEFSDKDEGMAEGLL
jgi:hypothetical protein